MASKDSTHIAKGKTAFEALLTGSAIVIALILLNVLTCSSRARVDLTQGGMYSLSDASRALVQGMKEKVNIKGYFGNVPPEQAEQVTYVDMMLSEYADRSNGKISYEKLDPWVHKELQDEIRKDGVNQIMMFTQKDDSREQIPIYFSVVFSHLDKKEVWVPSRGGVFSLEGLEYDFTSRIQRLAVGKKKVGVTTGFGEPPQSQVLQAPGAEVMPGVRVGLADLYDVQTVNWKDNPKSILDVDVLIVNGPTDKVSDAAKYNLDQMIMQGKPVLFLVGGMRWQSGNGQQQIPGMEMPDQPYVGMPADSGLDDLLATYGFKVGQDVILDARATARGWIPPGGQQGMLARGLFPLASSLDSDLGGILEGIETVALPYASTLKLVGPLADGADKKGDGGETRITKLLETSPASWAKGEVMAVTRDLKLEAPEKEHGPYLVAVAVSAKFKSYYADHPVPSGLDLTPPAPAAPAPDGELPPSDGEADDVPLPAAPAPGAAAPAAAPAGPLKESPSHTRVVVISSPTLVQDQTLSDIRMHGDAVYVNGFMAAHNMVDWLVEDMNLVAVRSKNPARPIDRLETGTRAEIKYANVIGAPLLLTLIGLIYWRIRERKRRHIVL